MRVLFSSAGRRVGLMRAFRGALARYPNSALVAGDVDASAPTLHEADYAVALPPVRSNSYVSTLVRTCSELKINAIVPLIDPELPVLAGASMILLENGVKAIVPSSEFVAMCDDKLRVHHGFVEAGLSVPESVAGTDVKTALPQGDLGFPLVIKPRRGSAGAGVHVCSTQTELTFHLERTKEPIVQEYLTGDEITIDALGDGAGGVLSMVPRKRLKTRAGEVERGITVDDEGLRPLVLKFAEKHRFLGPINLQCFLNDNGIWFTEVNARFGGGYPLAHAAGARFPELLLEMVQGNDPGSILGQYERGLVMTRFDDAFYLKEEDIGSTVRRF